MSLVVPIKQVIPSTDTHSTRQSVRRMCETLRKQGQIEPLQVKTYCVDAQGFPSAYITFDADIHANDILSAARLLEWDTVLIVEVKKYIQ